MSISEEDLKRLLKALSFAAHKHRDQRRKDVESSPYINHPISLANILCNEGHVTDVNVICAALLHDTVEDTDTTPEELEREFGKEITGIVMDVTDDKTLEKGERKRRQIEHAAQDHCLFNQLIDFHQGVDGIQWLIDGSVRPGSESSGSFSTWKFSA